MIGFKVLIVSVLLISLAPQASYAAEKTFIFRNASHTLEEFRQYAELAARLKPYGRVQIIVSALADKSWYEFPEGGSPWHEYCCYKSPPWKFFPHPKIAPHIPAEHVAANRKLLLEKAAVVRELGLEAAYYGINSHFLPESFFQQYPHLRGPRCDHPRRSRKEAFAWCVDRPETLEMIEWMVAELKRNVPELGTWSAGGNDAGSGFCWAAALYPGPNGPQFCRHINAGQRLRKLALAVHLGAKKGGGDITMRWHTVNFRHNEAEIVHSMLPENTYLDDLDPARMVVSTMMNEAYPCRGLFDPVDVIEVMERYHRPRINNISIGLCSSYDRADITLKAGEKLLDLIEDCIAEPTRGLSQRLDKLRRVATRWGGEQNREKVFEALYRMHEAFELKASLNTRYSNLYCGVSARDLTRPLVIKPDLLTPEEESYFLPHIFNIRENEARMDYNDLHGGRIYGTARWNAPGLRRALGYATRAAGILESVKGAPEEKWLRHLATSLRIWAGTVRSIHNFYHAQLLRDRYADILAGEPRIPAKVGTWEGDPGNLEWNAIMRDELDNTNELIVLLENGGMELVGHAKDPRYEDTFVLGPDLVEQLEKKVQIMRVHWLDVQDYLAPPHK